MAAAKVFLDANILVDIADRRPHELEAADNIYRLGQQGELQLFISESVATTLMYVSRVPNAERALLLMTSFMEVLPNATQIIRLALSSSFKNKEDAILYHLALHHRMDAFITRNKKDFSRYASPLLPVMSPKEFMKQR